MSLSKPEIIRLFKKWIESWNEHDIENVFAFLHDEVVFEHWTGEKIEGKTQLRKVWIPWFANHQGFKFFEEDIFYDESAQKLLFRWRLEWPSRLQKYKGSLEIRRGIDVIHFSEEKIIKKYSYSKTTIEIDGTKISLEKNNLHAPKKNLPRAHSDT